MKRFTRTAVIATGAALLVGTAATGTAHAYHTPQSWGGWLTGNYLSGSVTTGKGTAAEKTVGYKVSGDTCRAIVQRAASPWEEQPHSVSEHTTTESNGYFTVPVPADFQGKRAVTVEVQVGYWQNPAPNWATKRGKAWEPSSGITGTYVMTKKRFSAATGSTVTVGVPNSAIWPDVGAATGPDFIRVAFATGSAQRITLASPQPGQEAAYKKCRGRGATLGAVEHHVLVTVNNWKQAVESRGNGLSTIRIS